MKLYVIELVVSIRREENGSDVPDDTIPIGYVEAKSLDEALKKSGIEKLTYDNDGQSFLLNLPRVKGEKWVFVYEMPEILCVKDLIKLIKAN